MQPFYWNASGPVNFMFNRLKRILAVAIFVLAAVAIVISTPADQPQQRIVAVADIHGAYDAFVAILQRAEIIDAARNWRAGKSTFVQLGDILDRGAKGRAALDLLMQLEKQASSSKGKVIVLLGNHEVMNVIGDLRYVPAEEYANYRDGQSQKRQDEAYKAFLEFKQNEAKRLKQPETAVTTEIEKAWKDAHPLGYIEQRQAFSADGKYGQWLRKHNAIAQINDTIFLHGGINPEIGNLSIDEINRRVHLELQLFDTAHQYLLTQKLILPYFNIEEIASAAKAEASRLSLTGSDADLQKSKLLESAAEVGGWISMNPGGPLWFRGFSEWSDEEGAPNTANLSKAYKVQHFVVGHTVQPGGQIRARFNHQIFLIDTGMLDSTFYEGGRASALQISAGRFSVVYPDQTIDVP